VEGAGLWLNDPLPAQDERFGLLGTGVGLRLHARPGLNLALDLAWPLHDLGTTLKGDFRLHASGALEF
jgi:hemolysin activation/secretion protein